MLAWMLRIGDVLLLRGDLGVGKSELARVIVQTRAGAPIEVPSPSFTLVQHYETPGLVITHADLYRLSRAEETEELALDDAMADGCLLVEWPERALEIFPADALMINITFVAAEQPEARQLTMTAPPKWATRVASLLAI